MKVDKSGEGIPSSEYRVDLVVGRWRIETEPVLKLVTGSHVVAGEDIKTPKRPQKHILSRPASETTFALNSRRGTLVILIRESVEAELTACHVLCDVDQRERLRPTESKST